MITTCLPGERYGRWIVIEERTKRAKNRYVLARCECGTEREIGVSSLKCNLSRSCGCYNSEQSRLRATKHGASQGHLYKVWVGMRKRCRNPNSSDYPRYGGRGIKVCRAWEHFETFCAWAISNGYTDDLTIERKDNEKGYSPSNCRWATMSQQGRNTRPRQNKSGYRGVSPSNDRWRAQISIDGRVRHLGVFDDPFSAAWIRDEVALQLYEHATTNNLIDRRKRKELVMLERRGTFKRKAIV